MVPEDLELTIAKSTPAGQESLRVLQETRRHLSDEQRMMKSFELTDMTRQIMRDGIRQDHPEWSEAEVQTYYVDRLLSYHCLSLEKIDQLRNGSVNPT